MMHPTKELLWLLRLLCVPCLTRHRARLRALPTEAGPDAKAKAAAKAVTKGTMKSKTIHKRFSATFHRCVARLGDCGGRARAALSTARLSTAPAALWLGRHAAPLSLLAHCGNGDLFARLCGGLAV
jgi:hypothetical protein